MKTIAVVLSLALSSVILSSAPTPAFASKMNGKCCQSSDGGRSYRYQRHMARRAVPHTCSNYAALCMRDLRAMPNKAGLCTAAKAQCMQTGVYVGPVSGRRTVHMART
jgi:hypothetical protein